MNINPGEGLLTKLAAEATQKIGGFIAQNLSNTIWCARCRDVLSCRLSVLGSPCRQLSGLFMLCRRAFSTLGALNVSGVHTCAEILAALQQNDNIRKHGSECNL